MVIEGLYCFMVVLMAFQLDSMFISIIGARCCVLEACCNVVFQIRVLRFSMGVNCRT